MVPINQHIKEVNGLLRLIQTVFKALVWVEVQAWLPHLIQVDALLHIWVHNFNAIYVPLLILECGEMGLGFARLKVKKRVHFDLNAEIGSCVIGLIRVGRKLDKFDSETLWVVASQLEFYKSTAILCVVLIIEVWLPF